MPPRKVCIDGPELLDSWGRRNRKLVDKQCQQCGRIFRPKRAESKYCSRPCMWANNGKHNQQPDGGETWWVSSKGHIEGRVWIDGRPRAYKQHRWIMEQHIGRTLDSEEDVHHIDEDKTNNRIENLRLMPHGEHSRHHNLSREYKRGYKLELSAEERERRANQMRRNRACAQEEAS